MTHIPRDCLRACMHAYVHVCVRTCVRVYLCACTCARRQADCAGGDFLDVCGCSLSRLGLRLKDHEPLESHANSSVFNIVKLDC